VRRKGRYTAITAPLGSEEFDRQYWSILRGLQAPSRTTWALLVESYCASDRWLSLRTRTRADYERVLGYLLLHNAARDVTRTKRADVLAAMEANRHRTRFANYIPAVMSVLMEHAIDLGWRKDNPAKGVRRLAVPADRKAAHVPWPDWAVDKFRAEAAPLPRLIFEIGVGTVQRPGDWARFRWEDFDGKALRIVQGKTGVALYLPCTTALVEALGKGNPDRVRRGAILRKRDGNPMSYRYLSQIMLAERKRLGVEAFDLHALRYRGVQELARAGCTDEEIAAYSGHESLSMIRHYSQGARQEARADQAATKRNG
jgi:hypothetical protein